jgi:alpha,alpha-trehalose phosphorylase (configuration-retaining)
MWFGPDRIPRLSISYRNQVEVDNNCIDMVQIEDYEKSVAKQTWEALKVLSKDITDRNIRVSFFNATPQGGLTF